MKISRKLTAEIKRAIEHQYGHRVTCEVGNRLVPPYVDVSVNALLWPANSDLFDMIPLHKLAGAEVVDVDGAVELDVYVYTKDRYGGLTLDDNVTVVIDQGKLVRVLSTSEVIERSRARREGRTFGWR